MQNEKLNSLYWQMDFRESEPVSSEREEAMKRIAHEIVEALTPKKLPRNYHCEAEEFCKADCRECLFWEDLKYGR